MRKCLLFISCAVIFIFAENLVVNSGETKSINGIIFEDYSGDFVIKNNGILVLENCTFKNNILGSKNSDAIFSAEKPVAPIVNYGNLSLVNCKFINNYSWNTALNNNFEAQAASGAIINFGELELADNNTFENNWYQKGNFTVLRNDYVEQFDYIGNDTIFNFGTIEFVEIETPQSQTTDLQIEVALLNNLVSDKAEFFVKVNKETVIKITVFDAVNDVMFSVQKQIQNEQIIEWNLTNLVGTKVAPAIYSAKIETENFVKIMQVGVKK